MAWVVKQGVHVSHDGKPYVAGDMVPCTDEQAAQMQHAVERVQVPSVVEKPKRK